MSRHLSQKSLYLTILLAEQLQVRVCLSYIYRGHQCRHARGAGHRGLAARGGQAEVSQGGERGQQGDRQPAAQPGHQDPAAASTGDSGDRGHGPLQGEHRHVPPSRQYCHHSALLSTPAPTPRSPAPPPPPTPPRGPPPPPRPRPPPPRRPPVCSYLWAG